MSKRGPSSHHARDQARARLEHNLSAQRQQDILNRLRKGHGFDLSVGRRDQGRWFIEDSGEPLVVVCNRARSTIITVWRLQEGTRAWHQVEKLLQPRREAEAKAAAEAAAAAEETRKQEQAAQEAKRRADNKAMMGDVSVPAALRKAKSRGTFPTA